MNQSLLFICIYMGSIILSYLGLLLHKIFKLSSSNNIKSLFYVSFVPLSGTLIASFIWIYLLIALVFTIYKFISNHSPERLKLW
jgi:fructose-specific phosphotransferase system IIC component